MHLLNDTVHWLLAGCCGLALLNLAVADYVAGNKTLRITQKPRFYGVITNRTVGIVCLSSKQHLQSTVQWFKASKYDSDKIPIHPGGSIFLRNRNLTENAILLLTDLSIEDQGVYFCKINNVSGPGTEVQVAKPINITKALYRSQLKDGLMILQGLMLAACIAAYVFRKRTLSETKDSIYEEPEVDHIYEGLAIETCEGDLYEEISVYAHAEGAEAPWE